MSLTSAPGIITQLATQWAACASWTTGANGLWYPEIVSLMTQTFPVAVLAERSRSVTPYAAGAAGIPGGVLEGTIYSTAAIGVLEALARTILDELLAAQSGIVFRAADCGLSTDPSPGKVAGASGARAVTLSLPWGLSV